MVQTVANEEIEGKIKEFIDVAEKFDERYKQKIFEVLLADYLKSRLPERAAEQPDVTIVAAPVEQKSALPIDVKAFLQQYQVPEEKIPKLFYTQGTDVRPIYHVEKDKPAVAQVKLALMAALENALKPNGRFDFLIETVRERCREHGVYDGANFKTNFKNNAKFFKTLKDEEPVELSPDGKAELADVILAITE